MSEQCRVKVIAGRVKNQGGVDGIADVITSLFFRFRCLDKSGGTLLYSPEKTYKIVMAVSVLHNFCLSRNIATTIDPEVVRRNAALQPQTNVQTVNQPASAAELRRTVVAAVLK